MSGLKINQEGLKFQRGNRSSTRPGVFVIGRKWKPKPKKCFSDDNMNPQQFSLPRTTVLYMIKRHKNLTLHKKFMKLCKYFFSRNPVVPIEQLIYNQKTIKPSYWTAQWNLQSREAVIDLVKGKFKMWIVQHSNSIYRSTSYFDQMRSTSHPDIVSKCAAKIYQCDQNFIISNQVMSYDDLKTIVKGDMREICLTDNIITYNDGSTVPLEVILEYLLHIQEIQFSFPSTVNVSALQTTEHVTKIVEVLSQPNKIRNLRISNLTEAFDFATLSPFLLGDQKITFQLSFIGELPPFYKNVLENFIVQMLQRRDRNSVFRDRRQRIQTARLPCHFANFDGQNADNWMNFMI